MTIKHTPGPWSVHELEYGFNSCPPPLAEMTPGPDGKKIQVVAWDAFNKLEVGETDVEASRANAHLIAAAPDLLKAVEGLLWYVLQLERIVFPLDDTVEKEEVIEARIAIAKAEGKAT